MSGAGEVITKFYKIVKKVFFVLIVGFFVCGDINEM